MSEPAYFTPAQLAERLQTTAETVIGHIRAGRLGAFSLSPPGCKRPRYRITPDAVTEFEESQQVRPPAKPTPRRRKTSDPNYIHYF